MKEFVRKVVVWILTWEARGVLRRYRPNIVLITGSVGKTSTKDAVYAALSPHFFVRRSEKSYNSDIGVPLTVLGVPSGWSNPLQWARNIFDGLLLLLIRVPYPEWLVVEVSADRPGDIRRALAWLRPTIVVATRFPEVSVHVEFYDSPEEVQKEESAPLRWLRPGGVAVVNADDELVGDIAVHEGVRRITYGFNKNADVHISRAKTLSRAGKATGMSFDVSSGGEKGHVTLNGVVGVSHLYAALGGIAAALGAGVPLSSAVQFDDYVSPAGRMKLIEGDVGTIIVDDSYNSSPIAVEDALKTMALLPRGGKRIAILGDMLELGAYSVVEHEKLGALAAQSVDMLVTVGMRARKFAEGAENAGMPHEHVLQFDRALDAAQHVHGLLSTGDVILVKGSQSMRMERAVKELMAHPEDAKKLLCRQEAEWLTR